MDYSFFILPVGSIDRSTVDRLLEYSVQSVDDPRATNYFGKNVNKGFGSHSIPSKFEDCAAVAKDVVESVRHIFSPEQYTSIEMNWLAEGGTIREHTDQSSATSKTSINEKFGTLVNQWHSLHVPLCGSGLYTFRRSLGGPEEDGYMESGVVYLFNNYAMHRVLNIGPGIRRNAILHFHDPKWESKRRIYGTYNIRGMY